MLMEGVGARTGRSSSRYGPTTVFTGPVRKWKKKWIHVTPPTTSNNSANHQNHQAVANGNANGSHLLLYKWAPIASSQNNGNGKMIDGGDTDEDKSSKEDSLADEEPRKRKFKYIPVAVLEEQLNEAKQDEYEAKADDMETDQDGSEPTPKSDTVENMEDKPDINDVPTDVDQDGDGDGDGDGDDTNSPNGDDTNSPVQRQDLNVSTLDLSLGLTAHDGENESETKTD